MLTSVSLQSRRRQCLLIEFVWMNPKIALLILTWLLLVSLILLIGVLPMKAPPAELRLCRC